MPACAAFAFNRSFCIPFSCARSSTFSAPSVVSPINLSAIPSLGEKLISDAPLAPPEIIKYPPYVCHSGESRNPCLLSPGPRLSPGGRFMLINRTSKISALGHLFSFFFRKLFLRHHGRGGILLCGSVELFAVQDFCLRLFFLHRRFVAALHLFGLIFGIFILIDAKAQRSGRRNGADNQKRQYGYNSAHLWFLQISYPFTKVIGLVGGARC